MIEHWKVILGGEIPDTLSIYETRPYPKRWSEKNSTEKTEEKMNKCSQILNSKYQMISGSPDEIFEDGIIEM